MKLFQHYINRNNPNYKEKHYRAHWQPLWAIIGFALCSLLILFSGWAAVYDLWAKSEGVSKVGSIVDLIAAYLGVSGEFSGGKMLANMSNSRGYSSAYTLDISSYVGLG